MPAPDVIALAVIAALVLGCGVFVAVIVWLLRPHRRHPEPMEYEEPPPRVYTRIWDGRAGKGDRND